MLCKCGYNGLIRGNFWLPPSVWLGSTPQKETPMGEKGSKKDKNKANKQKQKQLEKKQEQQKAKLPAKKPV